jgi:hypothetical protein
MNIFEPYVYLIGWSTQDRYYIGAEYSNNKQKIANPANLWTVYFTSSKTKVRGFVADYGDPDIIQIRKTFRNAKAARKYEHKVLRRLGAVDHPKLLNEHNGGETFCITGPLSSEHKAKLSKSHIGKTHSTETKEKLSKVNMGKTLSPETRNKQSKARKGRNWYNDGAISIRCHPNNAPVGFVPGRLNSNKIRENHSKVMSGRRHYNNGKVAKMFFPNEVPDGFVPGRIVKSIS